MPKLILITGAPCSGKTETIELLKKLKGFPPLGAEKGIYIVPEAPTYLCGGEKPLHNKPLPKNREQGVQFDKLVYHSRVLSAMQARERDEYEFVLFDRGTLDGLYYTPRLLEMVNSDIETELGRYDAVILMEALANLGEDTYTFTDSIRTESALETLDIERNLISLYQKHPKFFKVYAKHNNIKRASILLKFLESLGENR